MMGGHIVLIVVLALLLGLTIGAAVATNLAKEKIQDAASSTRLPFESMQELATAKRLYDDYIVVNAANAGAISDKMKYMRESNVELADKAEELIAQNLELKNDLENALKDRESEPLPETVDQPITKGMIKNEIIKPMVEDIIWLLGYINRLKQNSEHQNDTKALRAVQENLTTTKGVWRV